MYRNVQSGKLKTPFYQEYPMDTSLVKAEIDLNALEQNIRELRKITAANARFMAVVKADAYGHGVLKVAQKALESGADCLGVARLHEAEGLRRAGIDAPILIFGFIFPEHCTLLSDLDVTATVYNRESAQLLDAQARKKGVKLRVHLKIDTGMGRVGMVVPPGSGSFYSLDASIRDVKTILKLNAVELEGMYTHFAKADDTDRTYTLSQIDIFSSFIRELKKENIHIPLCHAANSAAIMNFPESHFDMVRAGISIYGFFPAGEMSCPAVSLKPAMALKTIVTFTKKVPKGFKVSYGSTYEAEKETIIASTPIGYADGYSRLLSSRGHMLVKGEKAPIAGRVCMDQTLIDVGHIPGVRPGDEVVVMGRQGNQEITADDIAQQTGTINYEIVSGLTSRVQRVYSGSPGF